MKNYFPSAHLSLGLTIMLIYHRARRSRRQGRQETRWRNGIRTSAGAGQYTNIKRSEVENTGDGLCPAVDLILADDDHHYDDDDPLANAQL